MQLFFSQLVNNKKNPTAIAIAIYLVGVMCLIFY